MFSPVHVLFILRPCSENIKYKLRFMYINSEMQQVFFNVPLEISNCLLMMQWCICQIIRALIFAHRQVISDMTERVPEIRVAGMYPAAAVSWRNRLKAN